MLLISSSLWIVCLAEFVLLITYVRAASVDRIPEDFISSTEAVALENYKISTLKDQHENITALTSIQTKDKQSYKKLLSPISRTAKMCNKSENFYTNNDIKTLIESQVKEIGEKNITLTQTYQRFENASSGFMDEPDETVGNLTIDLGKEYVRNTTDFLILIKNFNSLVITYKCMNSSRDIDFDEIPDKGIEDNINHNRHVIGQFGYLFNLSLLYTSIYWTNEDAFKFVEEYNAKRDLDCLRRSIESNEVTKQLIDEYIPYLKKFQAFMGNESMHEMFVNPFTEHLVDMEFWEEQAINMTNEVKSNKKYLSEETHRILIQERIQPAVQGIIFIVGFVGNLVLLVIFARHKEIRNPPNMMILNLAIGDAFNLIINIPTFHSYYVSSSWNYGVGACKAFRFFRQVGIAVSVYSVVMISIQRFLALKQIYKRGGSAFKMSTRLKSTLIILSVWMIAALLATPHTIYAGVYNGNCYGASSEIHENYSTYITLFDFILFCTIPVIIIVTLSLSAAYLIKRSVKNIPGESMGMDKFIKNRILSSNVLIGLTIVSAISYIPFYLFMLIYAWSDIEIETPKYIVLFFVLYTLSFSNCCFNPIALYTFSGKFRKYFNVYFLCRKLAEEDDSSKQTSTGTNISTVDTKL